VFWIVRKGRREPFSRLETERWVKPTVGSNPTLILRLVADRKPLDNLPVDLRSRSMKAVGELYCPDVRARKGLSKVPKREHKA
jgi:hypothetical protein